MADEVVDKAEERPVTAPEREGADSAGQQAASSVGEEGASPDGQEGASPAGQESAGISPPDSDNVAGNGRPGGDGLTGAGKPRSRFQRAVIIAGLTLFGAVVAGGLIVKVGGMPLEVIAAGISRLVTEGPREQGPRVIEEAPADPAADPLAGLSPELKGTLVRGERTISLPFRFMLTDAPSKICEAVTRAGIPNNGWAKHNGATFECLSDLVPLPGPAPAEGETAAAPSTLFFLMRGAAEDEVSFIRLKLNLDDARSAPTARARLLSILRMVAGHLTWTLPAEAEAAIGENRQLSIQDRGLAIEIRPENDGVERVNVVIFLKTPAQWLPTDRFADFPPVPDAMLPRCADLPQPPQERCAR